MNKSELSALISRAKEYAKKHRFNPLNDANLFSILNVENKEVAAHSAFLYFVFKPFVDDGGEYDCLNLRILLSKILHRDINGINTANIRREVRTDFGRLDFLIEYDNKLAVIELKIWAKEQPCQIERYKKYLAENMSADGEGNVFFLTPDKREATTGFAKNITLKEDIKSVLLEITERRRDKTKYCRIIEQYISLIDKITGGNGEERDMQIFRSAEDLSAVSCLIAERKKVLTELLGQFFEMLKEQFVTDDSRAVIHPENCPAAECVGYKYGEESIKNYYLKRTWPAVAFRVTGCNLKGVFGPDISLYFFVETGDFLYAGFTLRKGASLGSVPREEAGKYADLFCGKTNTAFIKEAVTLGGERIYFNIENLGEYNSFINLLLKDSSLETDNNKLREIASEIEEIYRRQFNKFLNGKLFKN